MNEEIKEICGYKVDIRKLFETGSCDGEGFKVYKRRFLVSNMARCYDMKKERFLKDYFYSSSEYGIWYLGDYCEENKHSIIEKIHVVVAETWCKKPCTNERLVIDHIDGNKKNNLATNLRFITYRENANAQDVQDRKSKSLKLTTQHRKETEALVKALSESTSRVGELESENIELQNEITKLKRDLSNFKDKLLTESNKGEENIFELKEKIVNLEKEISEKDYLILVIDEKYEKQKKLIKELTYILESNGYEINYEEI